jgi:hypothetical protein
VSEKETASVPPLVSAKVGCFMGLAETSRTAELSWTLAEEAGKLVLVQIAAIRSARVLRLTWMGHGSKNSIILRAFDLRYAPLRASRV